MNENLNKYILEGLAMEDLMKRQDDSFILTESGELKIEPKNINPNILRKMLVESILAECSPYSPGITGLPQYGEKKENPKLIKTRSILSVVQDLVWKMEGKYDDEDVNKTLTDACAPLVKTMIQKLYDIWFKEEAKPEVVSPPAPTSPTPVITPSETPTLELSFVQGESLKSPLNKEYIVEEVFEKQLKLKDKQNGSVATVSIDIAKKWKNK